MDDLGDESEGTGTNTPAGEPGNDFFSSWEKPSIKRPSNPPSRTGTPGINRTASPFLNPNGNGNGATSRPKSPLKTSDTASDSTTPAAQPTASRAIPSSTAVRKTATAAKPKSNILGAKKAKLGAKKVDSAALDFDEAEKKAREEAERKERLGYDPDEVSATPAESTIAAAQPDSSATTIHQPTPLSPGRAGGFGSTGQSRERSDSEMEKLGMATRKLGFGQVGAAAAQKASTAGGTTRGLGFGAVSKPVVQGKAPFPQHTRPSNQRTNPHEDESQTFARSKFGEQKGISSDEFFGRNAFDPSAQSEARSRLQGFEGAQSISSNAYFGRPDEDVDDYSGDLETAAKDFVRRFGITAGDDIENLTGLLGEGAQRLRGAVREYLNG